MCFGVLRKGLQGWEPLLYGLYMCVCVNSMYIVGILYVRVDTTKGPQQRKYLEIDQLFT